MARTPDSSKWYIPLVAGTEVSRRSGNLTTFDPDDLIGQLPDKPCYVYPGLVLWLDSAATSTVRATPTNKVFRWEDRSGNSRHATEDDPAYQPLRTADGIDFKD